MSLEINVKNRLRVFLDIAIDNIEVGRIVLELYSDILPKTAANFYHLCVGDKGIGRDTNKPLSYKNAIFHRVVKGFIAQSGDFSHHSGVGGESIYGGKFPDEGFPKRHYKAGMLSMANSGKDSNGSQFFLTFKRTFSLDNKHVAFGHVKTGMKVLKRIEEVPTDRHDKPMGEVRIVRCGDFDQLRKIEKGIIEEEKSLAEREVQSRVREAKEIINVHAGKSGRLGINETEETNKNTPKNEKEKKFLTLQAKFKASTADTKRAVMRECLQENPELSENSRSKRKPWTDNKTFFPRAMTALEAQQLHEKKSRSAEETDRSFAAYLRQIDRLEKANLSEKTEFGTKEGRDRSEEPKDSLERIDALAESIKDAQNRRRRFSRRRRYNEDRDVSFINRRNEMFNAKVARAFDKYTFEIKGNLERGTAL